jgi:TP901 family phage tail tape measure protein
MSGSTVSLTVRLVDQLSGAASKISGAMQRIGASMEGMGRKAAASGSKIDGLVTKLAMATLAAGGISNAAHKLGQTLSRTVKGTAEFDDYLQGIAQTGELSAEKLKGVRKTILDLAPVLGRKPGDLGKVVGDLVAAGLDPQRAVNMLKPIGRVAVGQRAELDDVGKASLAMVDNMDIAVDRLEAVWDKVAKTSKLGRFEIKDMAQYLPKVGAVAASQMMKGEAAAVELAAALQVIRKTVKDPSSAATNLEDLLFKSRAPETVKKYEKHGVDIKKAIDEGLKLGKSPLETIVAETRKLMAKDPSLRASDFFADKQAFGALSALVQNFDEFIKIRSEASSAAGIIAADFAAMATTTKASFDQLAASADSLSKTWGDFLAPAASAAAQAITRLTEALRDLMTSYPMLGKVGAFIAGGFVALGTALGSVSSALIGLVAGVAILKAIGAGAILGGLFRAIGGGLRLLLLGTLIPLIRGGGIVLLVMRALTGFVAGVLQGFAAAFLAAGGGAALAAIGAKILAGISAVIAAIAGAPLIAIGAVMAAVAALLAYLFWDKLVAAFDTAKDWVSQVGEKITSAFQSLNLSGAAAHVMESLLSGFKSAAGAVEAWVSGWIGKLKSWFSFTATPTIAPKLGGLSDGAPTAIPQSAPGGFAPRGDRRASAGVVQHVAINVSGGDPERAARAIVTALDRYRQAGLYDGALA